MNENRTRAVCEAYLDPNWIEDLREFLKDQQDAEYHTDGPPSPNTAMRLLIQLNECFPEEDHA